MAMQFKTAFLMLVVMSILTGLFYPLAITALAQGAFPAQANGSLLLSNGRPIGSCLIGQPYSHPKHFWGRPSATGPFPYNAAASSGSNLCITNPVQREAIAERVKMLRAADPENTRPVPADLVTASGSGLDPHISPEAAEYQVMRVSRAHGIAAHHVRELIRANTSGRQFGILGEPTVNVLQLNLALDGLADKVIPHSWKDAL